MVHLNIIEARLSHLGIHSGRSSRPELLELQNILMDDEEIISLANGRYFAGFATLVATDRRLLIIDKRAFSLTVEDVRYDMISELNYNTRLLEATIHIFTVNKQHRFSTYRHREHLRNLTKYVQQRVMELRQGQLMAADPDPAPMPEPPPNPAGPEPPTHTEPADIPPAPMPHKDYRHMASRLSGRILGPVAVKATQHHNLHMHVPNPYTKASFIVHNSGGWLRDHTPQVETGQVLVSPEV